MKLYLFISLLNTDHQLLRAAENEFSIDRKQENVKKNKNFHLNYNKKKVKLYR